MNHNDDPGTLLSLDMCEAFDPLKWDFIFKVFESYGFGNYLNNNWLKTIYQFPKCRIINNNFLSQFFEILKGVRQGDPLSPAIFILCMQCLASIFKQDVIFKGVMLTNETLKLTMFADDILLFLSGKEDQFERIFTILHDFAIQSDCKLNMANCQAFHVGRNRDSFDKSYLDKGLLWPKEIFKYLGIFVPIKKRDDNDKKLVDLNSANVIDKTKSILNLWSCRNLTLIGKITILKSLEIPKVTYKASMLPVA